MPAPTAIPAPSVGSGIWMSRAELAKLPTYQALPAVKAGHSYGLSYFFADRYETGLKSLESLETTLKKLA